MSETGAAPTPKVGPFELVEREYVTATDAEKTLLARPRKSIRRRLAIMMALFAIGSLAITVVMGILLTVIERKIHLIAVADQLNYEIFQARRFEKNFLLYGSDLEHVEYHIDAAHIALERSVEEFRVSVSTECLEYLEVNLWHYRELIGKLRRLGRSDDPTTVQARSDVQQQLRESGSNLVTCGQQIANKERESIDRWLTFSKLFPAVYLLLVVALSAYAATFMRRHIMQRLELLMAAARRIGAGDFSPIVPVRKSRDELTDLAIAINRMTHELERRQEFLLQSQKLRAVGSLTAGIAHEVNNPINNIMLTAAVLQEDFEGMPESEQRELIGDIEQQAERASRIVRNLLDFARESEIRTERLNIKDVVRTAVDLAANQLKLSGIRLVRAVPDDLPEILGDPQYLSQVFLNIILNAVDAMPGGGTLSLSGRVTADHAFLAIDISDTGSGMSSQVQSAIFDPFFTTKSGGAGTGLGLSVSLGIVQKHGGDIKVSSQPGAGSTFTVILPLAHSTPVDSTPSSGHSDL